MCHPTGADLPRCAPNLPSDDESQILDICQTSCREMLLRRPVLARLGLPRNKTNEMLAQDLCVGPDTLTSFGLACRHGGREGPLPPKCILSTLPSFPPSLPH